jgi:hypothetical protein
MFKQPSGPLGGKEYSGKSGHPHTDLREQSEKEETNTHDFCAALAGNFIGTPSVQVSLDRTPEHFILSHPPIYCRG